MRSVSVTQRAQAAAMILWLACATGLAGPHFETDTPAIDFGTVMIGSNPQRAITLRNTGDAELLIHSASAGDRLQIRGTWPLRIAPGESGAFTVAVRDTSNRGRFREMVSLQTSDPQNAQPALSVSGEVKWYLEPSTPNPQLGRVAVGEIGQSMVMLFNRGPEPLEVALANPQSGAFRGTLVATKPGREFRLHIDFLAPNQAGSQRGDFVLRTNQPAQPELHIHPIASIPKPVDVTPPSVILDQRLPFEEELREGAQADFAIRVFGPRAGRVLKAAADDARIPVDVVETVPGRIYRAVAKIPPGYVPDKPVTIRMETDHPDRPLIVVGLLTKENGREWRPAKTLEGNAAPTFDLETTAGRLASGDLGQAPATVLNFVAPDCGFCSRQMPDVDRARQEFEAWGVRFVAVSQRMGRDFSDNEALRHYAEIAPEFEVLLNHTNSLGDQFLVSSYPSLFVLDKDGRIRSVLLGAQENMVDQLRLRLNEILAAKP